MEPWTIIGWILVFFVGFIALVLAIALCAALVISIRTSSDNARAKNQLNKN